MFPKRFAALATVALLTLAASTGTTAGAEEDGPSIHFRNGDTLRGVFHEFDGSKGVKWRHPSFKAAAWFGKTNVMGIYLGPGESKLARAGRSVIQMANGDELTGRLISITTNGFEMETAAVGKLMIPRDRVRSVWPRGTNATDLYEGPQDDSLWTHGDMTAIKGIAVGKWLLSNGAFVSTTASSVARNLNLPNEVRIDFRLQWAGFFSLAIGLHTDSLEPISLNARHLEPDFAPFYSLWISNHQTELRVVPKEGEIRQLERVSQNFPPSRTNSVYSIFCSEKGKSVSIMADGRLIKKWIDPKGWSAGGKGIRFVHQGQGAMRISDLRVSRWDGASFTPMTVVSHPTFDLVLHNRVQGGRLDVMTNGVFRFQSDKQWLNLPFASVRQMNFAGSSLNKAIATNATRIYLSGRGRLSGELNVLNSTNAIMDLPGVGKVSIKPDSIVRLKFSR
ncbi:MAG: hypothetical protein ACKVHO_08250 [Verrucomicrobiia bacterium]|jgi:hypothetical protein